MKINSDKLLNDARKLRKTQDESRSTRSSVETRPAAARLETRLDQMSGNLRTHRQNITRLQLESIGLDQLYNSVQNILEQQSRGTQPDAESLQQIETIVDATRFQQQQLIPGSIREMLRNAADSADYLKTVQDLIAKRRLEVSDLLGNELQQVNRIQVSFENIISANVPETGSVKPLMADIKQQLDAQSKRPSADVSKVNPHTALQLLQDK